MTYRLRYWGLRTRGRQIPQIVWTKKRSKNTAFTKDPLQFCDAKKGNQHDKKQHGESNHSPPRSSGKNNYTFAKRLAVIHAHSRPFENLEKCEQNGVHE